MKKSVTDKKHYDALHEHFITLVNKHKILDRLPRGFGLDEPDPLIGSQMLVIEAIGKTSVTNVTEVARVLGITMAAASQSIGKIYKKGYIRKLTDENNKREVLLMLTDKGQRAYEGNQREWEWSCENFLQDVTEEEIEYFNRVAKKVIEAIDNQIEKCSE